MNIIFLIPAQFTQFRLHTSCMFFQPENPAKVFSTIALIKIPDDPNLV